MEKHIIGRGLVAGALAGVIAFVFARIFVEPVIDRAIGFEDGVGEAHEAMHGGHEHGAEVLTRGVQANIGLGFGVIAFSVAMGALFAVVFAVAYGRVGNVSARVLSLYVAGGMLLSLYVVPALKYPANPPRPAWRSMRPVAGRAADRDRPHQRTTLPTARPSAGTTTCAGGWFPLG